MEPVGVNQGVLRGRDDFDVFQTGGAHTIGHKLSRAAHVGEVSGSVLTLGILRNVFSSSRRRVLFCSTKRW